MGNPDLAKVLTPLHGTPLIGYVLDQARALAPDVIVAIIGHQREAVRAYVATVAPEAQCVVQEEQRGTGHAVQQTRSILEPLHADVIILSGDVPLLSAATLRAMVQAHRDERAACTVLTTSVADPTGYGRIIRDQHHGALLRIVEHKDATSAELLVHEINAGVYVVRTDVLFQALDRVHDTNAQGEFYLTDIIDILKHDGATVIAYHTADAVEVQGINTIADLQRAEELYDQRR